MEREYEGPGFEHPVDDINWTAGIGQPAGIYWVEGRTQIAAYHSPAEAALLRRGAVLVATLLFGPDPLERGHVGRAVRRVDPAQLSHELGGPGEN